MTRGPKTKVVMVMRYAFQSTSYILQILIIYLPSHLRDPAMNPCHGTSRGLHLWITPTLVPLGMIPSAIREMNHPLHPKKTPAKPTAGKSSLKHKSLHNQLQLVADSQTQACYKIAKMQAEERGGHADRKANTKWQGAFEVEHLRIQFQCEESLHHHENLAAQHTHELMILDRQIELERAKTGGPMSNINNINPAFH